MGRPFLEAETQRDHHWGFDAAAHLAIPLRCVAIARGEESSVHLDGQE